jgi:hypothetical protein
MNRKMQFGSWWLRLRRGGTLLSPVEQRLMVIFREAMPPDFHPAIDAQFAALNLAQRDMDWKGVRLYRISHGKVRRNDLLPLPCAGGQVKLLSTAIKVTGHADPIHVVFWAVDKVFFGFTVDVSLKPYAAQTELPIEAMKHSWRSQWVADSMDRRAQD